MFSLNDSIRYWLYNRPTDMRKSYYTLSGIVTNELGCDPCNGDVYIFMNKSRNRIKLLHWEPGGLVLYCKLLESGTFGMPLRSGEGCRQREDRMERTGHDSRGHNRTAGLSQTATGESEETT